MNIKWNEYTWYSKLGALILFIFLIPILAFYIGTQYQKTSDVLSQNGIINSFKIIPPHTIACTAEAKQCPDGSYVGRTGPNCQFSACPGVVNPTSVKPTPTNGATPTPTASTANTGTSGIFGKISLGPSCPVMMNPPDPQCADKSYQATLVIKTANGQKEIARVTSDKNGAFRLTLSPGSYLVTASSGATYPSARSETVDVSSGKFSEINIYFDSGIR